MPKTEPFDRHPSEYDRWFVVNKYAFRSELEAVKIVLPSRGKGIEIGIGSGMFAEPLGITEGIEPSPAMRERARQRNIKAIDGVAEDLPYPDQSIDFVLMVTTVCFVDDIYRSFEEVYRILKHEGRFIIGFVDKNSLIGKEYLAYKNESVFYREAVFFSTEELYEILDYKGFAIEKTYQTVFGEIIRIKSVQDVLEGYGQGSFVVILAKPAR